jgi:DNA-binding XRE family transcriptional regulator
MRQNQSIKKRVRGKKKASNAISARLELYDLVNQGALSLGETVRQMRLTVGKTQAEYARLVKVAPRIIIDLERGVGNPTLETMQKIGAPFGLAIGFRSPFTERTITPKQLKENESEAT